MTTTRKRTYADRNKENWADLVIREKMLAGARKGSRKMKELSQRDRFLLEWRRLKTRYGKV